MTTTATTTLSAFIAARLDEDEAEVADNFIFIKAEGVDPTGEYWWECRNCSAVSDAIQFGGDLSQSWRAHAVRCDRVLATCAAHRAIVALHSPIDPCDAHNASFETVPCPTLRAIASIWADAEGFDPDWS